MSQPQVLLNSVQALLEQVQDPLTPAKDRPALAERINKLYSEVVGLGNAIPKAIQQKVARLVVLNQVKADGVQMPIPHNAVVTHEGTINQYDASGGPNSSCTSCAQCFLARVLPRGTSCSVQPAELDDIVRDGYRNFDLLLKNKQKEAETLREESGFPLPLPQAMDTNECSAVYGLKVLGANQENGDKRFLRKGVDGTTKGFFRGLLEELQKGIDGRNALGSVIHSQGKTYALALFQNARGYEWALFDSHGVSQRNGRSTPAYMRHTDSLEEMVTCLHELIEYKSSNDPSIMDLPQSVRQGFEEADNEFILYIMEHEDHVILAEIDRPSLDVPLPNPEEVDRIQQLAFFLLFVAAVGGLYKYYASRRIPQDVVPLLITPAPIVVK